MKTASEGPNKEGLRIQIRKKAGENIQWSIELIQFLISNGLTDELDKQYWDAIIYGWEKTNNTDIPWDEILTLLEKNEFLYKYNHAILELFNRRQIPQEIEDRVVDIVKKVFDHNESNEQETESTNWHNTAINTVGGKATEIWISILSKQLNQNKEEIKELPQSFKSIFDELIVGKEEKHAMGRDILASQMPFLFHWFRDWVSDKLFPLFLFDENDKRKAFQVWDGYLYCSPSQELFKEFKDYYVKATPYMSHNEKQYGDHFVMRISEITFYFVENPWDDVWLKPIIQNSNDEFRNSFSWKVNSFLMNAKDEEKQKEWDRWLKKYWQDRIDGTPHGLSNKEKLNMLQWLCYIGSPLKEAITLTLSYDSPSFDDRCRFFYTFVDEDCINEDNADLTANLLLHLLKPQKRLKYLIDEIDKWLNKLKEYNIDQEKINENCDQLDLLGYNETAKKFRVDN